MHMRNIFSALTLTTLLSSATFASDLEIYHGPLMQTSPTLHHLDAFLQDVHTLFLKATTSHDKQAIVGHIVNAKLVKTYTPQDAPLDLSHFQEDICEAALLCTDVQGRSYTNLDKTTPLSLAITLGRKDLVTPWIEVIDDINSDLFASWGYRQPFSLVHHALDPEHPVFNPRATLQDRLDILDLLAAKGANFNKMFKGSLYNNPALAAGDPRGWGGAHDVDQDALRARALLHGADPTLYGTSFSPQSVQYKLKGSLVETLFAQDKAMGLTGDALAQALHTRSPSVTYALARAYYKEGDLSTAALHMRAAAEKGVTKASHTYGTLLAQGKHEPSSFLTSVLDMLPYYQQWRLSAYRDEAIQWLEKGHGKLRTNTLISDEELRTLYELNLEEGRATANQLLMLGDYYKSMHNTAYTNYRMKALGCYMAATKHKASTQKERATAHRKLGDLYNTPYLEVLAPTYFFQVQEAEKAQHHYLAAAALGSKKAESALTALEMAKCLAPTHPHYQNMTHIQGLIGHSYTSPTPLSITGSEVFFLGNGH